MSSTYDERREFMKEVSHRIAVSGWAKHVVLEDSDGMKNVVPMMYDETMEDLVQKLLWSTDVQGNIFVRLSNGDTVTFQVTGVTGAISAKVEEPIL